MEPADYSSWLSHQNVTGTLASEGAELFRQLGCSGCHIGHGTVRSPPLDGLYGRNVSLQDGTFTVADDHYLRDSILLPNSQVVSGYAPLMPSFAGRVTEDELIRLIAYIKSLADNPGASP
jgi:cytochrome c oxidase subunit 2